MEKIKIQSEEKNFFEFIQKLNPITGVFGYGNRIDKSSNPHKLIEGVKKFLVLDKNLKVVFENKPFSNHGNYHPNVVKKLKELKLNDNDDTNKSKHERTRTDDSVEDLINNLLTSASLKNFSKFYSDEVDESGIYKRLPIENFDIESSSIEFEEFDKICGFMDNATKPYSESRLDTKLIEYETFTETGKKAIDDSVEWFKNNKSATPVQDAWFKVLEKNGIKVNYKPFDLWCTVPVMKQIDYSSKEEIDAKRKLEDEAFRKSITPQQRESMRKLAEQFAKK